MAVVCVLVLVCLMVLFKMLLFRFGVCFIVLFVGCCFRLRVVALLGWLWRCFGLVRFVYAWLLLAYFSWVVLALLIGCVVDGSVCGCYMVFVILWLLSGCAFVWIVLDLVLIVCFGLG